MDGQETSCCQPSPGMELFGAHMAGAGVDPHDFFKALELRQ